MEEKEAEEKKAAKKKKAAEEEAAEEAGAVDLRLADSSSLSDICWMTMILQM